MKQKTLLIALTWNAKFSDNIRDQVVFFLIVDGDEMTACPIANFFCHIPGMCGIDVEHTECVRQRHEGIITAGN